MQRWSRPRKLKHVKSNKSGFQEEQMNKKDKASAGTAGAEGIEDRKGQGKTIKPKGREVEVPRTDPSHLH